MGQNTPSIPIPIATTSQLCPPCDLKTQEVPLILNHTHDLATFISSKPIKVGPHSITCDATPCDGFFQYDAPNHLPIATQILSDENKTYTMGKYKIFFPESTEPKRCTEEWAKNKKEYQDNGMSAWQEDLVIFGTFFNDPKFWNSDRFYMEIGGHNGVRESNTRMFDVCLGWKGLLIEPVPFSYHRMVKLRPNAHHLGMAPSCKSPDVVMFYDQPYTSGVANDEGANIEIHCGPVSHPLKQLGIQRIDFWSLDVEGSELAVLKTVDFDAVQIDVIMAESENRLPEKKHLAEEVRAFLKGKGYIIMKSVTVFKSDIFLQKNACPNYMHIPECSNHNH